MKRRPKIKTFELYNIKCTKQTRNRFTEYNPTDGIDYKKDVTYKYNICLCLTMFVLILFILSLFK